MAIEKLLVAAIFALAISSATALYPCDGLPVNTLIAVPDSYNCSIYFECYNGQPTSRVCPDGLYFSERIESCEIPSLSGCTNKSPFCRDVITDYFPDPLECTNYIECYHGVAYVMSCPEYLWFDAKTKKCVQRTQSDCTVVVQTTPPPYSVCLGVSAGEIVLKTYEGNCNYFWRCIGLENTLERCPQGLYFDESREICDFQALVPCHSTNVEPTTSTPVVIPTTEASEDPRCIGNELEYYNHPADCHKYIECYGGASYEMDCPNGMNFNDIDHRCEDPLYSECGRTIAPPRTTKDDGLVYDPDCVYPYGDGWLYPYPGDCTRYFECAEGTKVSMDCPETLFWHDSKKICDYPYLTNCLEGR